MDEKAEGNAASDFIEGVTDAFRSQDLFNSSMVAMAAQVQTGLAELQSGVLALTIALEALQTELQDVKSGLAEVAEEISVVKATVKLNPRTDD